MKLEKLRTLVDELYGANHEGRDEWTFWLYPNHVLWVAKKTEELCERFGGNKDIAVAGALVHDIADTVMQRKNANHEKRSLEIGRELTEKAGYMPTEVATIIDDIAQKHSCHDGVVPESLEGKLVAAADACAHFQTDFYLFAFNQGTNFGEYDWQKNWARKKIEHDFNAKIFDDEIRADVYQDYLALKRILSY